MDPGAVDSPVTLVIKAPNQKYDDQTINCFLNWTVEKLKSHISNVYPSKPSSKDQRLVYSGHLLQDHLQLRDVLRKQEGYHMMHLVCASRSPPASPTPRSSAPSPVTSDPSSSSGSSDSAGSTSQATTPNQDSQSASSSVAGSYDGLRHRGGFPQFNPQNPTSTAITQWPDGTQVPVQGGMAAGVPPHPMYMPMQVLWWQQMYARHYYMQYQAAVAASQPPSPPSPTLSPQPAQPNEAPPPRGPNPAPNPIPEDRPANPNIQMNAQGGAVLDEDELNRDWLDWMYTVSRAAILLSIVYFYSSFGRFVMVIGAMLLVFLHRAGWFPFRPELQNPRGGGGGAGLAHQDEAERHQDIQEMERIMDEGLEDEEGDSGEEGPEDPAAPAAPRHHGFLAAAWSFISTFFTSLIPEGPPQPAN
ncbi:homocysteine-responsive endoplasmic reticulum-resident ubiquitin-like domain member 2 protein [Coregonus clupeaformis]|uniref:homocysteine-responsive endoplasmic reticulum-resident ubiquitin-like domain member 2 protein n=1 Tax=Coregonus clupeaformis TaxID=59861 RepID=UPI001E1C501B|nr:homocysteine-responsive endoplasmic reticulum-resident ubiquitin-like domain member 2 protein [Coregonus clupeaformis]